MKRLPIWYTITQEKHKIMNIDIKFIDENTVEINASLEWSPLRPPPELKKVRTGVHIIKEFNKKYPAYTVDRIEGTDRIFNCKKEELSRGTWTLTVSKKQKSTPSTPPAKKTPLKRPMNRTAKKGA